MAEFLDDGFVKLSQSEFDRLFGNYATRKAVEDKTFDKEFFYDYSPKFERYLGNLKKKFLYYVNTHVQGTQYDHIAGIVAHVADGGACLMLDHMFAGTSLDPTFSLFRSGKDLATWLRTAINGKLSREQAKDIADEAFRRTAFFWALDFLKYDEIDHVGDPYERLNDFISKAIPTRDVEWMCFGSDWAENVTIVLLEVMNDGLFNKELDTEPAIAELKEEFKNLKTQFEKAQAADNSETEKIQAELAAQIQETERLQAELQNCKKQEEELKNLTETVNSLERDLAKSKKSEQQIQSKYDKLKNEFEALKTSISETEEPEVEPEPVQVFGRNSKILFIGNFLTETAGTRQALLDYFPNCSIVTNNSVNRINSSADLAVFLSDYLSHEFYSRCKGLCEKSKLPYIHSMRDNTQVLEKLIKEAKK